MATIDRHYFRVCIRGAIRVGLSSVDLLRSVGVDPAQLESHGWRGDVAVMAKLVRLIWDELGDEAMGFTDRGIPRGSLSFATGLARDGDSVAAGLSRAIEFYNLVCPDIRTSLELEASEARLQLEFHRPELDPDNYFSQFWLIIWHRLACWLAGETVQLLKASFDYGKPYEYFEEFKYLFPCPMEFDAKHKFIVMDAKMLLGPVRRTEHELHDMLAVSPLDIMTIPASDHSIARRVRSLLQRDCTMNLEQLAKAQGMSSEALRKRLRREGASVSQQRAEVRRDAALRALSRSNRSIEAIASDLGYEEARSFTRAFRNWTGEAPSHYRHPRKPD